MYFIYVSTDLKAIEVLEQVLFNVDKNKRLLTVANGYDLIHFLQNVKRGESYPDLIILSSGKSRLNGKELLELLKTDDIYRLIPVIMLLPERDQDAPFYLRMGTDTIIAPNLQNEWTDVAVKMCAACDS
jgi:CheY-like chemotaxis protein